MYSACIHMCTETDLPGVQCKNLSVEKVSGEKLKDVTYTQAEFFGHIIIHLGVGLWQGWGRMRKAKRNPWIYSHPH